MAAAALLACAIASAEPVPVPRLTIPKCSAPPTVDGKIAEGEWAQAAAVTGFLHHQTGQMTERQPVAWLTYDDQNLYIAVRSPISEGTKLKRACRERDALRLCADDVIEVFVNPQPGQKAESFYQFLGNSIGMILDFEHQPPIGRTVAAWNGQWDFKCATTKEHWDAELAVPLSDVKIPSSADGTRVGLNLCRDWQNPSLTFTCWSLAQTFADTSRMAEVTLGGSCPAVQLLDVTGLLQNRASVRLAVASTGGPELLTAEMEVKLLQTREVIFTDKKEIGLAAGERKAVWFDGKLGAKGKKLMRVTVAAKEGGRTYYEAIIPFTDGARDGILAGKQRAFEVYAGLYPSKNLLKVEADILDYDRAREVKAVGVEVRPEGSALVIASGVIEKFELGHGLVDGLKLPELAAGKYRVTFRATGEAGKQLAVEETEFEKRTFPWFKEKAGVTDEVIPPFTPLMVKGTTVNCWGREHMFGDNGLLEALATRGAQILRSPVRLAGKAEGRELVWRPRGPLKVAEAKPHVARLAGFSIADDLRAEVKTEVEFDGLMKVHVKVSPDREMDLESLRLEVPLNDENALLYHAVGDTIRMTNQAGELPKGTGRIWSSASIQNMVVRGSFIPYLWIGDHDRGLCWMAESDRGWTTDPSVGCLELTSEKNVVTLVVNLVAAKRVLREPVEFAFALQATPVKPLPLGWRTWRSPILAGDGRPMHVIADKSLAWQGYGRPQQPEALKRRIADLMESEPNAIVQPAVSPNDLWGGEEGRYFAAEWSPGCPLILRNDFQLWHFERAVRDFGVNGAYSDSTGPVACRNVLSGCGYVRDDNVQAGFNLLGNRDFHRRLAAILHQHRTGGRLTVNTTDAMVIPCFSFADSSVDGEDARPLTGGRDYLDGWRLDMVRARMMGRQWGLVSEWLPTGAPEASWGPGADDLRVTRSLLALTLLHDVLVHWNHRMDPDEVAK
ncbi:MAG: hypothetical protein FJ279_21910, partial [Planctomycetes bacterium]|nr:hypothetical protein [Planctomycetota bacterium]